MNIKLEVNITDAEVDPSIYKPDGAPTLADAVRMDLHLYRAGEISLEELIYNFGGDVSVTLTEVQNEPDLTDYSSGGEVLPESDN